MRKFGKRLSNNLYGKKPSEAKCIRGLFMWNERKATRFCEVVDNTVSHL